MWEVGVDLECRALVNAGVGVAVISVEGVCYKVGCIGMIMVCVVVYTMCSKVSVCDTIIVYYSGNYRCTYSSVRSILLEVYLDISLFYKKKNIKIKK